MNTVGVLAGTTGRILLLGAVAGIVAVVLLAVVAIVNHAQADRRYRLRDERLVARLKERFANLAPEHRDELIQYYREQARWWV